MKEKTVQGITLALASIGSGSLIYAYHGIGGLPPFHGYVVDFLAVLLLYTPIIMQGLIWSETTRKIHRDYLTGVYNRIYFDKQVNKLLKSKKPFQLVMIDLCMFKGINDTYGHRTGDEVLKIVAKRLSDSVRPGDTVARLGGDEFTLLILGEGDESLYINLIKRVESDMIILGNTLNIGLSVGVTTYPNNGTDHSTLMSQADCAMYYAKRNKISLANHSKDQISKEER